MVLSDIGSVQRLDFYTRLRVDAEEGPIIDALIGVPGVRTGAGPGTHTVVWVDASVLYKVVGAQAEEGRASLPPKGITIYVAREYAGESSGGALPPPVMWSELERACMQ